MDLGILKEESLYPWQKDVLEIITNKDIYDTRSIYWIYENEGMVGKSAFIKFIAYNYDCLINITGKSNDITFAASKYKKEIETVICDIPKTTRNKNCIFALEKLKDGFIFNTRCNSVIKLISGSPVVIVFANSPPNISWLSIDRWKIFKIVNKELIKKNAKDLI